MGKQGPCYHCGITTTPLWRNGPQDKPVLCNACGSRWRTKGTLDNYMPMHAGGFGSANDASAEMRCPRPKKGLTRPLQQKANKRKSPYSCYLDSETAQCLSEPPVSKSFDEDFSNRSSLGSTISTSETSMHHCNGTEAELPAHMFWDTPVPSKRRTTMCRFRASSEKMTKSLMASEEPDGSSVTCPCSNALLVHNGSPLVAVEVGLGSVLLSQPFQAIQEPESEVSSFLMEKKECDVYGFCRNTSEHLILSQSKEKGKNIAKRSEAGRLHSQGNIGSNELLLENYAYNKHVFQSCQSPLVFLELKDVVNFDTFMGFLTHQEKAHLMKLLPSEDTLNKTDSLKDMFNSSQFEAALENFQHLLSQGMFDVSDACQSHPLLQHLRQLFTMMDLNTSGWMEQYLQLQNATKRRGSAEKLPKFRVGTKDKLKSYNFSTDSSHPFTSRTECETFPGRPPDRQLNSLSLKNALMPKDVLESAVKHTTFGNPSADNNGCNAGSHPWIYHGSDSTDFFLSPQGHRLSGGFGSTLTIDEQDSNSDLDLLVNIPSNSSFQQAELLQHPSSGKCSYSSLEGENCDLGEAENDGLILSNTWHMDSASAWDGLIWKNPCSG